LRGGRGFGRNRGASTTTAGICVGAADGLVGASDGGASDGGVSAVAACWSIDMASTPSPHVRHRLFTATLIPQIRAPRT
jgi:hypothetical protein